MAMWSAQRRKNILAISRPICSFFYGVGEIPAKTEEFGVANFSDYCDLVKSGLTDAVIMVGNTSVFRIRRAGYPCK